MWPRIRVTTGRERDNVLESEDNRWDEQTKQQNETSNRRMLSGGHTYKLRIPTLHAKIPYAAVGVSRCVDPRHSTAGWCLRCPMSDSIAKGCTMRSIL